MLINNFPSPISDVALGNSDLMTAHAQLEYSPANGKVQFSLGMAIMCLATSLQVFSDKCICLGKREKKHAHSEMQMYIVNWMWSVTQYQPKQLSFQKLELFQLDKPLFFGGERGLILLPTSLRG